MTVDNANDRVRLRDHGDQGNGGAAPELLVDDASIRYGRFPDGTYFLYENAYVWSDDLLELGRRLVTDRAHRRIPNAVNDQSFGGE
jgi:hypothetical protein